jgi:hypothetical protein
MTRAPDAHGAPARTSVDRTAASSRAPERGGQPPVLPQLQMMQLATGHFRAQAIYVAAKLGIADLLRDGPRSCEELARSTKTPARALYRLLRALASIEVFAEREGGRFELTPLAETLRSDTDDSLRPLLLVAGEDFHWGSWSHLLYSVTTGESAFEHVHEKRFFEYLAEDAEAGANFAAWMTRATEIQIPAILGAYDFSAARAVVDVGGGQGRLLAAILRACPRLSGVLFDRPEVVAGSVISSSGLADRCSTKSGSFFESVPRGGDLYLLKTILHDWGDDLALRVLRNCRDAMEPDARALVIEMIVPPGNAPHPSKFMDLNMLVLNHGGMERTEEEFRALLRSAGLEIARVIPTRSPLSLIECRRTA